jgi:hypothetical protein
MRNLYLVLGLILLAGCGAHHSDFQVINPGGSSLNCVMDLGDGKKEFPLTSSTYTASSDSKNYIYLLCAKSNPADPNTITVQLTVDGEIKTISMSTASNGFAQATWN